MHNDNTNSFQILADQNPSGENGEVIPLMTQEDEEKLNNEEVPTELPLLPVKNTVLFPGVVMPITVGRDKSINLVKEAYSGDRIIGVTAQKNAKEDPGTEDLYEIGTVAHIVRMLVLPDGSTTIIIQGRKKFQIQEFTQTDPYFRVSIQPWGDHPMDQDKKETQAIIQSLRDTARKILELNPEIPQEAQRALEHIESPSFLIHFLSSNISASVAEKQRILELSQANKQAEILLEAMTKDVQMLELKQEIQNKVHSDIDQQQRDYYLRQQMKVLQEELGQESAEAELEKLRERGDAKNWPQKVHDHFNKEIDKLARMNPASAEYPMAMNYVEFLVDLPWEEYTEDNFDLQHARQVLDEDHYGMEKVKERIIEYLAVLKLTQNLKAPILCLYGPPGVGKTSLGKSVARALGREYSRVSLGGLHDESEIRGHRRTYIGAMPGKIISNIKKIGSSNPVMVLDEVDKVGHDFRGDPSSALLEVLDPEQNSTFTDNYLEVEYDLSKVLFIATANTLDTIQPALRDRMEIIELNGYALEEKMAIARRHLLPKQLSENGLADFPLKLEDEGLKRLIQGYTRESGVRNLEREIGSVTRKIAKKVALDEEAQKELSAEDVREMLGPEKFDKELYQESEEAGVAAGLAWTAVGGEILFIESSLSLGKGKLTLSGQLGEVMKESAMAALSYLKSHAEGLGIDYRLFEHYDIHIHIPAGAVPKDGPSAGITMLTALASAFTQRKVRPQLAMTGEITLRGKVLPVGGIKEKLLAAKRAGIEKVLLCEKNRKDVEEIDAELLHGLQVEYVESVGEVIEKALTPEKAPRAKDLTIPSEKLEKSAAQ